MNLRSLCWEQKTEGPYAYMRMCQLYWRRVYVLEDRRPESLAFVPVYIFCVWLLHRPLREDWVSIHTCTITVIIFTLDTICVQTTLEPTGFKCEHAWAMKICAASHTREHLIYGSSFRERKGKRLATPSYITKAKGDCLQPRYKPLGNLPSHRTCQPVVILPTLLYHMPPPLGHKQIPGTHKAFVHSGCFGDVLNFRVGGGGSMAKYRELWSQTCLDFSFPSVISWLHGPGYLMTSTSPTSYKPKPKLSIPWSPAASPLFPMLLPPGPGPPGPVHWEGTSTDRDMWMKSLVALSLWFPFL